MSISIVDYGLGNIGSVSNMLKRIGVDVRIASSVEEIVSSERVLLPGVGAFDTGMSKLSNLGFDDAVREFAHTGRPLLGICLGMQLLLDGSEEGSLTGLGLVPGHSQKFDGSTGVRVPHMGWNLVHPTHPEDPILANLAEDSRFYFVHSYHVVTDSQNVILATTDYGVPFTSMLHSDNVIGAQFHPEKSHAFGMRILQNFAEL